MIIGQQKQQKDNIPATSVMPVIFYFSCLLVKINQIINR